MTTMCIYGQNIAYFSVLKQLENHRNRAKNICHGETKTERNILSAESN